MAMKTPRVNSAMLSQLQGRTVRLTGKVVRLEGDTAILECSDNGNVTVKLNRDSNFADAYVEVICKVTGDTTVSELTSYNLGDNLDMKLVEAVVQSSRAYPYLFNKENEDDGMHGNGYH
ncbi:replication factor A protein 3 [Cystobasidium minutum MCA 4210]|uniref:replication factor A protein 3 n=1 Tax=Cystobasidium minutum MCA 4210 TaxID=1397322 RepID=UPI0034CD80B3|eukprot:jgi/Rhomi1/173171/fgenesh1_kg.5_\